MESEDEIDIESEYNNECFAGDYLSDSNEPPSKLALLHPDINQHPWTLEQDWYLENTVDEKSRHVIEKMMLEEQYYVNSGQGLAKDLSFSPEPPPPTLTTKPAEPKPSTSRRQWTEEEKNLFFRGLEIFGRKWSKIAELLPNRTVLQVKHFGYSHFRKQGHQPEKETCEVMATTPNMMTSMGDVSDALHGVTTAQPTTLNARAKVKATSSKASASVSRKASAASQASAIQPSGDSQWQRSSQLDKFPHSELIRINKPLSSDSEEVDIDIEDDDEALQLTPNHDKEPVPGQTLNGIHPIDALSSDYNDSTLVTTTDPASDASKVSKIETGSNFMLDSGSEACGNALSLDSVLSLNSVANCDTEEMTAFTEISSKENENVPELFEELDKKEESEFNEEDTPPPNTFNIQGSDGKMFTLPNPSSACDVDPSDVSERETEIFCEFFDGRPGIKTAERYMKIRSHIINMWKSTEPNYLYKTMIRSGLKKCGDVNIIGRIHAYLEQTGAINFGCEECQYNRKVVKRNGARKVRSNSFDATAYMKKETLVGQRKRKVRDVYGLWIDERDMEGRTIDHETKEESIVRKEPPPKVKRKKPAPGYDPFKLVPCSSFSTDVPAPFEVEIDVHAMLLMDTHAHLCKTEVIGLMGGVYHTKRRLLQVLRAVPCRSISTGMQCDMEPVSQTEASEEISRQGLQVVGWYHSHPTFPPNPSVRDMETQHSFQEWFSVGAQPFVGVIVNPYNSVVTMATSDVTCLLLHRHKPDDSSSPFQFKWKLINRLNQLDDLIQKICKLVTEYASDSNRVDMLKPLRSSNSTRCMDKLLLATDVHLRVVEDGEGKDRLKAAIRNILETQYQQNSDLNSHWNL